MLAAPRLAAPRRRRQPKLLALAVALMVLGALGAVFAFTALGERTSVIAVASEIPYGQVIERSDLVEAQIAAEPALEPLPWSDVDDIVGLTAATDLFPGGLLSAGQVTSEQLPPDGMQLVGIEVPSGQLPATPLQPRDEVLLVPIVVTEGGGQADGLPEPVEATVVAVGSVGVDGSRVVDVLVEDDGATDVATRGSVGGLAIVLTGRG